MIPIAGYAVSASSDLIIGEMLDPMVDDLVSFQDC